MTIQFPPGFIFEISPFSALGAGGVEVFCTRFEFLRSFLLSNYIFRWGEGLFDYLTRVCGCLNLAHLISLLQR